MQDFTSISAQCQFESYPGSQERGRVNPDLNPKDFAFIKDYNPAEGDLLAFANTSQILTEKMDTEEVVAALGQASEGKVYTAFVLNNNDNPFVDEGDEIIAIVEGNEVY